MIQFIIGISIGVFTTFEVMIYPVRKVRALIGGK